MDGNRLAQVRVEIISLETCLFVLGEMIELSCKLWSKALTTGDAVNDRCMKHTSSSA